MRGVLMSDLHLEVAENYTPPKLEADVVFLVGDIHSKSRGIAWAEANFDQPVIYVPGNHEFWGSHLETEVAHLKALAAKRGQVHVLWNESLCLAGVRFFGAPFFTDFELCGTRLDSMVASELLLNDYKHIRAGAGRQKFRKLTAAYLRAAHQESCRQLDALLSEPFSGPTVVLSHYAPCAEALPAGHAAHPLDASFASDLSRYFGLVSAWCYGHCHQTRAFTKDGTAIYCNARGYPDPDDAAELNPAFNPYFYLDF